MMAANFMNLMGIILVEFFVESTGINPVDYFIEYGVGMLLWAYYRCICMEWAKIGSNVAQTTHNI